MVAPCARANDLELILLLLRRSFCRVCPIDLSCTVVPDEQDVVGVELAAVLRPVHAWSPDWHLWHREAKGFWSFSQKTFDFSRRYVPFDYVSIDQSGMTRTVVGWHSHFAALCGVSLIVSPRSKAVRLEVFDPVAAATAGRRFPNFNDALRPN